jgi:hypothetical protein
MQCAVTRAGCGFLPSVHGASPSVRAIIARAALVAFAILPFEPLAAQDALRPGEAYVTRFSGVTASGSGDNQTFTINTGGTVGSIIDIRAPGAPPQGRHWIDEPQRLPVTAGEVGQVFGVALDDANPPNVYLTATSAFGLHHTPDGAQWMPGMWGPGGPGAVYKLEAANRYRPRLFATVAPNGRQNTAPALGNIAFDRWNKQFFVSDLETGMIHRIGMNGADGGTFDHGTQGRTNFTDGQTRRPGSLPPIPFDPASRARITDCPAPFDNAPECWNFAASNRRVWGLGVHSDETGRVRLYYAVWSGPDFDPNPWKNASDDDKRNSVWSVALGPDGAFAPSEVRREFVLPDFFVTPDDVARAGYSHPASDISFPTCSNRPIMLVAERGGIRNLGLAAENAFAYPHESRALRYELDRTGAWRPIGRYDVGFYDRQKDGPPFIHANCAGGIAFGLGYGQQGRVDPAQTDQFVWITGDSLCSPDGPCNAAPGQAGPQAAPQPGGPPPAQPASQQPAGAEPQGDDSEVHGLQGMREDAIAEVAPASAFPQGQNENTPVNAVGINEAYLIDVDINVDAQGNPIPEELTRNDATLVGDVAIYEVCARAEAPLPVEFLAAPPDEPPPPVWVGHPQEISHAEYSSHGRELSHYRWGSHYPALSHGRWRSHSRYWSHNWILSGWHNPYWSHWPRLSHQRYRSIRHDVYLSPRHNVFLSPRHGTQLSPRHEQFLSPRHVRPLSPGHNRILSPGHHRPLSPNHETARSPSHRQPLSPYHNRLLSPGGGHNRALSPGGVHRLPLSPAPVHNRVLSPQTSRPTHDAVQSRSHNPVQSQGHNPVQSRGHNQVQSRGHNAVQSRGTTHDPVQSRGTQAHTVAQSRGTVHTATMSRRGSTTHTATLSRRGSTTHNTAVSRRGSTTHNATVSRRGSTTHNATVSRGGSTNVRRSTTTTRRDTTTRRMGGGGGGGSNVRGGGGTTVHPRTTTVPRQTAPRRCAPGQRC